MHQTRSTGRSAPQRLEHTRPRHSRSLVSLLPPSSWPQRTCKKANQSPCKQHPSSLRNVRLDRLTSRCSPDPYLLGAEKCGVDPHRCASCAIFSFFSLLPLVLGLVVEDAPVGIQSGRAAGCTTIGMITSHTREQMELCRPDYLVQNLLRFVGIIPSEFGDLNVRHQRLDEGNRWFSRGNHRPRLDIPFRRSYTPYTTSFNCRLLLPRALFQPSVYARKPSDIHHRHLEKGRNKESRNRILGTRFEVRVCVAYPNS